MGEPNNIAMLAPVLLGMVLICFFTVAIFFCMIKTYGAWRTRRLQEDIERALRTTMTTTVHGPDSSMVYFFNGVPVIQHHEAEVAIDVKSLEEMVVVVDEKIKKQVAQNCSECVVCLENFDDQEVDDNNDDNNDNNNDNDNDNKNDNNSEFIGPCGHRFHKECIRPWLIEGNIRTCPICRCFMFIGSSAESGILV